jgi:hypothetical protein
MILLLFTFPSRLVYFVMNYAIAGIVEIIQIMSLANRSSAKALIGKKD